MHKLKTTHHVNNSEWLLNLLFRNKKIIKPQTGFLQNNGISQIGFHSLKRFFVSIYAVLTFGSICDLHVYVLLSLLCQCPQEVKGKQTSTIDHLKADGIQKVKCSLLNQAFMYWIFLYLLFNHQRIEKKRTWHVS